MGGLVWLSLVGRAQVGLEVCCWIHGTGVSYHLPRALVFASRCEKFRFALLLAVWECFERHSEPFGNLCTIDDLHCYLKYCSVSTGLILQAFSS